MATSATASKVIDIDRGMSKIVHTFGKLDGSSVTVGLHSGALAYPGGPRVQDVGFWHEFGYRIKRNGKVLAHVPARSFLRNAVVLNDKKYEATVARLARAVVDGKMTREKALKQLGFVVKTDVQNRIRKNEVTPPSLSATSRRKGLTRTLYDSGHLTRQVDFEVKA